MFKYVIFDLDGTLLNTIDDLANAGNWVCRNHGWPTYTVEDYKRYVGSGMANLARHFVPKEWQTPEGLKQVLDEFMPYYDAHKADKTAPYPGIPVMLAQLKETGVSMAVLSNKADPLVGPIVEGYFPGIFPLTQGALDSWPIKPDPALLHRLMERMGAKPKETLFVGDSDVDMRTAKNGGLTSCGVLWGFRSRVQLEAEEPDFLAATAEELEKIILN